MDVGSWPHALLIINLKRGPKFPPSTEFLTLMPNKMHEKWWQNIFLNTNSLENGLFLEFAISYTVNVTGNYSIMNK